jgi:hypothetical protein
MGKEWDMGQFEFAAEDSSERVKASPNGSISEMDLGASERYTI